MNKLLTNQSEVEVLEKEVQNRIPFYNIRTIKFNELKAEDVFRIKVYGESTNYCHDMFGREYFKCMSDAKYDSLSGWSVELYE